MTTTFASEATQLPLELDLAKIKQKSVQKFLQKNNLTSLEDFSRVVHSCHENPYVSTYHRHVKSFFFKENIEKVWAAYKTIGPEEPCAGSVLGFGLQYSKKNNKITYPEDNHGEIEAGQVIILHLDFLWKLISIAVGHEITEVNENEKYIHMCYLEGGASKGMQYIKLKETNEGLTEIIHETFYKSHSDFRDKRLYPALHGLVISEFHKNVERKLGIRK